MEKYIPEVQGFVQLHASRIAHLPGGKVAYLAKFNGSVSIDCEIKAYTIDALTAFDTESPLVRWVFRQVQTHDEQREKVLGLIFSDSDIMCHVIEVTKK